ncbi:MAG: cytochrome c oxidase subunit II [Pseudonocardia sp.]|nr:cytochrome c oxidase subunit II [Pseudonocardia sp.]
MRRRTWARTGRRALLVVPLVLLLTGCTREQVLNRLRFGFPSGVTEQAHKMRLLWTGSAITALVVGVIVWFLIFWCCIRYRKRNNELPRQTKYALPIEIAYSLAPFPIIAGLFYFTVITENDIDKTSKNPAATVEVEAYKWGWQFHYDSYQGSPTLFPGTQTAMYTGGSSTEIPILVVPEGQSVQIVEHSDDVIHSFWVPEFLFKRDVIPYGDIANERDNRFEFTATSLGHFVGRCAELCGAYHSQMNFEVRVVSPSDFQRYLTTLSQLGPNDAARQSQAMVAIGQPPYATTTKPFNTDRTARSATK